MYNRYFTENDEIDVTEMFNAIPVRMSVNEKTEWLQAFDCLDEETQAELVGIRNVISEGRHTPVADDELEDENEMVDDYDATEAEAYFAAKADEFDRKRMRRR